MSIPLQNLEFFCSHNDAEYFITSFCCDTQQDIENFRSTKQLKKLSRISIVMQDNSMYTSSQPSKKLQGYLW